MTEAAGAQKNTAYGVFVQACWAQHKRQYPDELIHKEIEEFNKQCSVWWYNLSEQERDRFQVRLAVKYLQPEKYYPVKKYFVPTSKNKCTHECVFPQEMADRSNAQQAVNQYTAQTTVQGSSLGQQMVVTNAASSSTIPSFGSSFPTNTDYYIQGGQPVSSELENIFRFYLQYFCCRARW